MVWALALEGRQLVSKRLQRSPKLHGLCVRNSRLRVSVSELAAVAPYQEDLALLPQINDGLHLWLLHRKTSHGLLDEDVSSSSYVRRANLSRES